MFVVVRASFLQLRSILILVHNDGISPSIRDWRIISVSLLLSVGSRAKTFTSGRSKGWLLSKVSHPGMGSGTIDDHR